MGFLRVMLAFLVVLIALHLILRVVLRLSERRRLAEAWEAGDRRVDRDIFMAEGMAAYDRSLRKRLLWLVIILPMAALALLLYLVNAQ
jgi:Mg2+/citrate symporter